MKQKKPNYVEKRGGPCNFRLGRRRKRGGHEAKKHSTIMCRERGPHGAKKKAHLCTEKGGPMKQKKGQIMWKKGGPMQLPFRAPQKKGGP